MCHLIHPETRTPIENPFADYWHVIVPYCTGDIYAGDKVAVYERMSRTWGLPAGVAARLGPQIAPLMAALAAKHEAAGRKAKAARVAMLGSRTNMLLSLPMLTSMAMYQTLFA